MSLSWRLRSPDFNWCWLRYCIQNILTIILWNNWRTYYHNFIFDIINIFHKFVNKMSYYLFINGNIGEGPNNRRPTALKDRPMAIIDQWLWSLSESQPQPGLDIPYVAESSRNNSPTISGDSLNCNNKNLFIIYCLWIMLHKY